MSAISEQHVRVIGPAKRRLSPRDVWTSRRVAWILAQRDLKIRYKQSILGPPWLVLQPLGILVGLLAVFNGVTQVNTGGVPYVVFALPGMAAWTYVQNIVANGVTILMVNSPLIRRVAFPRTAFYTASLLANLVAPALILVGAVIGALLAGVTIPIQILLLPLLVVWLILMMAGVLFIIATLAGRFRDVIAVVPFISQAGMFLTPVGYPVENAPPTIQKLLDLNPLTGIVESFRWAILGSSVEALALVTAGIGTVLILVGGWRLYTRMETRLADFI
jgi:lipopolysaccharide transport system permease protein